MHVPRLVQGLLEKEGGFTLPQLMFEFGRYFMTWLSVRAGYAEVSWKPWCTAWHLAHAGLQHAAAVNTEALSLLCSPWHG